MHNTGIGDTGSHKIFVGFFFLAVFLSGSVFAQEQSCKTCHPQQFQEWETSQHAHANRLFAPDIDGPLIEKLDNPEWPGKPVAVIGVEPLLQFLVKRSNGRLQAFDHAWDTEKKKWFYAFEDEREPNEWGHWTQRSMNWNSRCAYCHMTDFKKNYDAKTDSYASTWSAQGINCSQCHGDLKEHLKNPSAPFQNTVQATRIQVEHSCASCHARREELTEDFKAGEDFHDHYRLTLANEAAIFRPDGQGNDEDFEYNSFTFSRLHHKGISCVDCHNPHSGKTILPVANNVLCMSCHTPPGQRGAVPIVPAEHSHHATGSTGASCVACHMPENKFMMKDNRRDHAFTIPDPVLTLEQNIPNACNTCHQDKTVEWAAQWTDTWYGDKMNRRSRVRARLIEGAQNVTPGVLKYLLPFVKEEEIPSWKASLTLLLGPWAEDRATREYLVSALKDPSPLVRSAAIKSLAPQQDSAELIEFYRKDPSRLVRLDAAWATVKTLDKKSDQNQELMQYLHTIGDQPHGALRKGQMALKEGNKQEAERWFRKSLEWDPSAQPHFMLGNLLQSFGRTDEAIAELEAAIRLDADSFQYRYSIALLYAEKGDNPKTISNLEASLMKQPKFGRGWYNLALAYSQKGDLQKAIKAMALAERYSPGNPEIPFASVALHIEANDAKNAKAAAERALAIDGGYEPARQFLLKLFQGVEGQKKR